jgi:hypothetical protein
MTAVSEKPRTALAKPDEAERREPADHLIPPLDSQADKDWNAELKRRKNEIGSGSSIGPSSGQSPLKYSGEAFVKPVPFRNSGTDEFHAAVMLR